MGDPWTGARFALINASPSPTHWVDVTDSLDAGVASLREHQTYLDAVGDGGNDPDGFLRSAAATDGERVGVAAAVTFELIRL